MSRVFYDAGTWMQERILNIAVLGAGALGCAIGGTLAEAGHEVCDALSLEWGQHQPADRLPIELHRRA